MKFIGVQKIVKKIKRCIMKVEIVWKEKFVSTEFEKILAS
jgi:hypothetical protein